MIAQKISEHEYHSIKNDKCIYCKKLSKNKKENRNYMLKYYENNIKKIIKKKLTCFEYMCINIF